MPFFDNASGHKINGGNFQVAGGNLNQQHYNNSVQVDGQGNAVSYVQESYQNTSGNSIINNVGSGRLTIIGQGDNAHIQLGHFGFQGNNGMYRMAPHPQVHISMPSYNSGYAPSGYSPPGCHFDPPMGHAQQFVSQQATYQPNFSNVDQFPRADVTSTASWNEPSGVARASVPAEYSVDAGSFYTAAPSAAPVMMPVPSPTWASASSQIPSPVSVPSLVPATTSIQMPVPSAAQNVNPGITPTSPVVSPPTQPQNSPQERTFTPPAPHLSVRVTRPEAHRSPSDLSQNSAHRNLTTPYPHRAVDQNHAHEVYNTSPQQDGVSTLHKAVSSGPTKVRKLERVSSTTLSHRSSVKQPSSSRAPQDTVSTPSNRSISTPLVSTSTRASVRSSTTQEDRLSARPLEKAVRGVNELELSLESMPPPAYSLEPETPFQTEDLNQEVTSMINSSSRTGADSQEDRYVPSRTEAISQEDHSVPDRIQPKKKKKKNVWKFAEVIMGRSKRNSAPVLEL